MFGRVCCVKSRFDKWLNPISIYISPCVQLWNPGSKPIHSSWSWVANMRLGIVIVIIYIKIVGPSKYHAII